MATNAKQPIVSSAYTPVAITGDGYIQNVGTSNIFLQFAAAPPTPVSNITEPAHILSAGQGLQVIGGVPSNTPYARVVDEGKAGYVIASD